MQKDKSKQEKKCKKLKLKKKMIKTSSLTHAFSLCLQFENSCAVSLISYF